MGTNGSKGKSHQLHLPIIGASLDADRPRSGNGRGGSGTAVPLPRRAGVFRRSSRSAVQGEAILLTEIQQLVPNPDSTSPDVYAERLRALDVLGVNPLDDRTALVASTVPSEPHERTEPVMDGLQMYLAEMGQHPLLTAAQEIALGKRIQAGDVHARDQMVNGNLRLVVAVAKRYARIGRVPIMDLIQEGNLGLIKAAEKFDWRSGYRFSTYATWWIWQGILKILAEQGRTIRIPVHASERLGRIRKAMGALAQTLGRQPRDEELAGHLKMPVDAVRTLLDRAVDPLSLSTPFSDAEDDRSIEEMREDENAERPTDSPVVHLTIGDLSRDLMRILETYLSVPERRVIAALFGFVGDTTRGKAVAALTDALGRRPTKQEVERHILERAAELTHMPVARVARIRNRALVRLRSRPEVMTQLDWHREQQDSWPSSSYQRRQAERQRVANELRLVDAMAAPVASGA